VDRVRASWMPPVVLALVKCLSMTFHSILPACCLQALQDMAAYSAAELAMLASSLAALLFRPDPGWLQEFLRQASRRFDLCTVRCCAVTAAVTCGEAVLHTVLLGLTPLPRRAMSWGPCWQALRPWAWSWSRIGWPGWKRPRCHACMPCALR
jgi:hypothetical protein